MRHSTLELSGRYTRPRAVDLEAAALSLPSLRPQADKPEAPAMKATGTDGAAPGPADEPPRTEGANRRADVQSAGEGPGPHLAYKKRQAPAAKATETEGEKLPSRLPFEGKGPTEGAEECTDV